MSPIYKTSLDWISAQQTRMLSLVIKWAEINSGSANISGLNEMLKALKNEFSSLGGVIQELPLGSYSKINSKGEFEKKPLASALHVKKHPEAALQIFLGGHMDTVYSISSSFQKTTLLDANLLRGPGVADMKGGLVILLMALEALERSPMAGKIGWEVLINPDEEIGSPGSTPIFHEIASRNTLGLLFEPAFADGSIVSSRKGSMNMTAVAKGRAAHAGRDFFAGRNAITALSKFLLRAESLTDQAKDLSVNVGHFEGGGPANIVPDLAVAHLNIRALETKDLEQVFEKLEHLAKEESQQEGLRLTLFKDLISPAKAFNSPVQLLFNCIYDCGKDLGLELKTKSSGGTCDGSRLLAFGLPNIDTLGPIGGNIHTHEEYLVVESLKERAQLTCLYLLKLANGDLNLT